MKIKTSKFFPVLLWTLAGIGFWKSLLNEGRYYFHQNFIEEIFVILLCTALAGLLYRFSNSFAKTAWAAGLLLGAGLATSHGLLGFLSTHSLYASTYYLLMLLVFGAGFGLLSSVFHGGKLSVFCIVLSLVPVPLLFTSRIAWFTLGLGSIAFLILKRKDKKKIALTVFAGLSFILLMIKQKGEYFLEQEKYSDRLAEIIKTKKHRLEITEWRKHFWIHADGQILWSTKDDWMFYEPMIHPIAQLAPKREKVLVLGNNSGAVLRELRKYADVEDVLWVPEDPQWVEFAKHSQALRKTHQDSWKWGAVRQSPNSVNYFLANNRETFDWIIVDLPDPETEEANRYYTKRFYNKCRQWLNEKGVLATQAGNAYWAQECLFSISRTIKECGFASLPLHSQVLSIGEWGWVIAQKNVAQPEFEKRYSKLRLQPIKTRWLTQESLRMLRSFGKTSFEKDSIPANTLERPFVLEKYRADKPV